MNMSRVDDDGGAVVIAIEEAEDPQALWVRVGPVFDGNDQRRRPGVWIEYQSDYMKGQMAGPLLLSLETWYALARAVDKRLQRRNRFGWPRGQR